MNSNKKTRLLTRLFGPDYVTDERIKAGADQAGNYSFVFVMILLWLSLLYGVIFKQINMVIIPLIIFLFGSVFYLLCLVKTGSFHTTNFKVQSKKKVLLVWILAGIIFTVMTFLLRIRDISSENIHSVFISCTANAIIWVFLFIFFTKFLIKKSNKILEKKIDENQ